MVRRVAISYDLLIKNGKERGTEIYKGTWHNALSLGAECTLINVTRKNFGEGISRSEDLEGLIEREKEVRPYVEYVDLKKRDNRMIEVEL